MRKKKYGMLGRRQVATARWLSQTATVHPVWSFPLFPGIAVPHPNKAQELAARQLFRRGGRLLGTEVTECRPGVVPNRAEVAIIGKSNVGKSTLLNALLRDDLATTSRRPGHTRHLRFFRVGEGRLALVDMPGYGFARVAQARQLLWQDQIAGYLQHRDRSVLRRVLLLLDSRRGLQGEDLELLQMMEQFAVPCQVVLTKADLVTTSQLEGALANLRVALPRELVSVYPVVHAVSAMRRLGMEELEVSLAMAAKLDRLPEPSRHRAVKNAFRRVKEVALEENSARARPADDRAPSTWQRWRAEEKKRARMLGELRRPNAKKQ